MASLPGISAGRIVVLREIGGEPAYGMRLAISCRNVAIARSIESLEEIAGWTVMHLHAIPRYAEDMADPRGGVRGVIPEKRKY